MESKSVHARHRKQVFFVVCGAGLCVLAGYAILSYVENNVPVFWTHIVTAFLVSGGVLGLLLGVEGQRVYRLTLWGVAIGLWGTVGMAPDPLLYYPLLMPMLMLFFLGRREGTVGVGIFLAGMMVLLLLGPELVGSRVYQTGNVLKFLAGYLFVTIFGWSYEKSQERFHATLETKNEQLQDEKRQLKQALSQGRGTEAKLEQTISELRDQTQLMETIFNSISDGVIAVDENGEYLIFNPSAKRIAGMYLPDVGLGKRPETYGLYHPDGETRYPADELPLTRALRGKATDGIDLFIRNQERPGGVHINVSGRPLQGDSGRAKGGVIVFRDITETKRTGARLEQSVSELKRRTQLMETVFKSVSDGVVVTGKDGEFLFVNPSAEHIAGMGATKSPSDQWAETYGTFYPDKETPFPSDELPLMRAMRGEVSDDVELFIRNQEKPEGVSISVSGRPLQDDSGLIEGGVIVLRDITRLKATESELRQTVQRLQDQARLMETVFNSMHEGILVFDATGRELFRNPSSVRISGKGMVPSKPDEWAEIYGIFYPDQKTYIPADENPLMRAMRGESTEDFEAFLCNEERPDGVHVIGEGRSIRDTDTNEVKAAVLVFRDITKLKKTEAELRQTVLKLQDQTRLMETIFNSISDGVVAADENGNFTIFNPSAERIVGIGSTDTDPDQWSDRYGIFFPDRETPFPPGGLPLLRAIRGEASDEVEMFIRNPKVPEGVYISSSGRPLHDDSGITKGGVIVFRDVTERVQAEEALSQAFAQGRLEIVDTILHNIGNAINSVATGVGTIYGQLERNKLVHRLSALAEAVEDHRDDWIPYLKTDPQGQKVMPFILALAKDFAAQNAQLIQTVERVESRIAHIVDIIRTQRSFENETMASKDINLERAIFDAVKMLQDSLLKRGVQIRLDCKNAPKEIRIQESKFHQMVVNLIKNAIEAIDDLAKSKGLEARQPLIRIHAYVQGDFLVLDVIDNGIGIEEKHFKIIFAAGYTTKEDGSGLGLHSIANFIIGSGGQIHPLSPGAGKGTTMRVKLRLASVALKSEDAGGI